MSTDLKDTEEYQHYSQLFADAQSVDDLFNDRYGFPRKDLALLHLIKKHEEHLTLQTELAAQYSEALANRAS